MGTKAHQSGSAPNSAPCADGVRLPEEGAGGRSKLSLAELMESGLDAVRELEAGNHPNSDADKFQAEAATDRPWH